MGLGKSKSYSVAREFFGEKSITNFKCAIVPDWLITNVYCTQVLLIEMLPISSSFVSFKSRPRMALSGKIHRLRYGHLSVRKCFAVGTAFSLGGLLGVMVLMV